jgi:hypothetical protein
MAPVMVAQTDREKQQPLVTRKRGKDSLPQCIVEKDDRIVVETCIRKLKPMKQLARLLLELGKRKRRNQPCFGNDLSGRIPDQETGLGIGRDALRLERRRFHPYAPKPKKQDRFIMR